MDFLKGSELRCSLPALDKLIQPCHEERREKRQRNGVKDFTVFSSILGTFFFTGNGERDYQASGCGAGVPDPGASGATEEML